MEKNEKLTPLMQQYYRIKEKYKDCLVFFRLGDFYELFDEDAKIASRELGIVLTSRDKKTPMAGVPHHAAMSYIKKLIDKGYKVAICEQMEEQTKRRGLMRREVVRVITPGTLIEEELLPVENNFLVSIVQGENGFGIAFVDVSTGEFFTTELKDKEEVLAEVIKYSPVEAIIPSYLDKDLVEELRKNIKVVHYYNDKFFELITARKILEENVGNIESLELSDLCIRACGAAISYIKEAKINIDFKIQKYFREKYMILDTTTLRNLEIFKNLVDGSRRGTLIEVLDKTVTPMGKRLLKRWLQRPLLDLNEIEQRLDAVEELKEKSFTRNEIRNILRKVYDIERIINRVINKSANARDLVALKNSLIAAMELKKYSFTSRKLHNLISSMDICIDVADLIDRAIVDDPPPTIKEGNIIKDGFSYELDELREMKRNREKILKEIEERERKRTGIDKLRMDYNSVIGYYIEVPKGKIHLVPKDYIRKQTLTNVERYTIKELMELEQNLLYIDEKIKRLEYDIFEEIRKEVEKKKDEIKRISEIIAEIDVLASFAEVAVQNNYTRPKVTNGYSIIIKDSRHPTVELTTKFVPNDVHIDERSRILIVTGPNMSGKSTYLRQIALTVIMAQVGSFVPASKAIIGIVDRIFTRIGSIDDITRGYSSFMVEMLELSKILKNATSRSLILLDEIGKNTSASDGLCIAWATVEYIHDKIKAKTLFATHFHEISELENFLEGVKNYHFEIREENGEIIFDRKIKPGAIKESYGIKVAKLANLPKELLERAENVSKMLLNNKKIVEYKADACEKLKEFLEEVSGIDVFNMTPIAALMKLNELKNKANDLLKKLS